jgi:serine-type D-Ala-D-Ala carboxypeptidase/endopeptidase (penicillin-binding protein 4)
VTSALPCAPLRSLGRSLGPLTILALISGGSPIASADPAARGPWRQIIDPLLDRSELRSAEWGIEIRSLTTDRVLYARNETKSLAPGSLLKLATTAAVLDALGPDLTLETTIETAGRIDGQGRLRGDVYLVGRGDPTLWGSSADSPVTPLDRLAETLRAAGLRRIDGRLIGHEGAFTGGRRGSGWAWEDLTWYYGAESAALSFNNGAVHLKISPGTHVGAQVVVERNPVSSSYSVAVAAITDAPGGEPELTIDRPLGRNVIHVGGRLPLGAPPESLFVAIEDPARFATVVFREALDSKGIAVSGSVETSSEPLPAGLQRLATLTSPPLAQIVKEINQPSHNQRAEMLLRLLGARVQGVGSADSGLAVVRAFLQAQSVDLSGWSLDDGSGLSHGNLVTARGLVQLLIAMNRHRLSSYYLDSLPVMGISGTVRRRAKGTAAEGRIRAKSGLIRHANSLAGYLTTRDGETVAFAILLDHHTLKSRAAVAIIDGLAARLAQQ